MTKPYTTASAISAIKSMRRLRNGKAIHWANDVNTTAHVVACILTANDRQKAMLEVVSGSGAAVGTIDHLIHGRRPGGGHWPALREALKAMPVTWIPDRHDVKATAHEASQSKVVPATAPLADIGTYRFDPESKDIFVMTTARLRYGTPEWCAKMGEAMLTLGVRK